MKKRYFLLLAAFLFCCVSLEAQIVGTNVYLQGHFLEVGELSNGALGTCSPAPAGYHPHCNGCSTGISSMAQVYDWGHDGWAVGTPPQMGDYTNPGFPFEGWSLEVNGASNQAYQSCTGSITCCTFFPSTPGTLAGSVTGYSNVGKVATGTWSGTAVTGGLSIIQETRIDTAASWVVFTVRLYNKTSTAMTNVYYERDCDPDNTSSWFSSPPYVGATSYTQNTIVYQNDTKHRVMVSSYGIVPPPAFGGPAPDSFNKANSYMALGTKDCRAKCTYFDNAHGLGTFGGLQPAYSPADVWAQTPTTYGYAPGTTNYADEGMGLVFNIGTICANDSAILSYAYIFDNDNGIDSAFPDPLVMVNGVSVGFTDTFDACKYPTLDSIPLTVTVGPGWGWGNWTWSPGTGLSATTGTTVWATITGSGYTTYTVTGTDSFGAGCNGSPCLMAQFVFTIKPCHAGFNNGPCFGDSLKFGMTGDSLGATYQWWGPNSFSSTLHDAFIFPANFTDTGWYYVAKTIAGVTDTDSTYVVIHPLPTLIVSDNSPLCSTMVDTLKLSAVPFTPGETFSWTGPASFTSGVEFPRLPGFGGINRGTYTVVATSSFGCKDTGTVFADTIPPPPPPIITDRDYCQDTTATPVSFVPFSVVATGTVLWYTGPVGGVGSTTPPTINTTIPGIYNVWATQTVGSCESPRGTDQVHVTRTPPKPLAAGGTDYCQYVGPFVPLHVTLASASAQALWYTTATGGTPTLIEPTVDINTAGTYNYWVSQTDSGCEGPRLMVVINVHAKPGTPVVTPQWYCQFWPGVKVIATASGSGDVLRWYLSTSDITGNAVAPVPSTATPGIDTFYVNETSTFGCIGDRVIDTVRIRPKPAAPHTLDTTYCQFAPAVILTADSLDNSHLNWYISGVHLPTAPTPPNNVVGPTTWYVSQTINGCESDSTAIKVTTIYQPNFYITPQRPYSCQFDSMWLAYTGPALDFPAYIWSIPKGTAFVSNLNKETGRSLATDSMIYVRFDSASQDIYFHLHASDNHGMCSSDTSIRIRVIPHPTAVSYSKSDVCAGDTVSLALSSRSADASIFTWAIDNVPMESSTALNIITHNTNTGGPFGISWNDSGRHVITVQASTPEGCTNPPTPDTVFVHKQPDASFQFTTKTGVPLCLEDSVQFIASASENYNYGFAWSPEHFFQNINKGVTWGKVEQSRSIITLQVTDPFGCMATTSQEIDPSSCCTVSFPNAFTPNMDGKNDLFRPIFVGYHRFHVFRIANRWGQTVYESTNSKMQWDGTYNGVPQEMGVYFYYLQFDCGGNTIEQSGDVTLIR